MRAIFLFVIMFVACVACAALRIGCGAVDSIAVFVEETHENAVLLVGDSCTQASEAVSDGDEEALAAPMQRTTTTTMMMMMTMMTTTMMVMMMMVMVMMTVMMIVRCQKKVLPALQHGDSVKSETQTNCKRCLGICITCSTTTTKKTVF